MLRSTALILATMFLCACKLVVDTECLLYCFSSRWLRLPNMLVRMFAT